MVCQDCWHLFIYTNSIFHIIFRKSHQMLARFPPFAHLVRNQRDTRMALCCPKLSRAVVQVCEKPKISGWCPQWTTTYHRNTKYFFRHALKMRNCKMSQDVAVANWNWCVKNRCGSCWEKNSTGDKGKYAMVFSAVLHYGVSLLPQMTNNIPESIVVLRFQFTTCQNSWKAQRGKTATNLVPLVRVFAGVLSVGVKEIKRLFSRGGKFHLFQCELSSQPITWDF